jgi:hypothetical protein
MNSTDIIIIYLAIGLPFGVHFYLKNRFNENSSLKSLVVTLIWIPYSIKLFQNRITNKLINSEFDVKLGIVSEKQKNLERILLKNNSETSLFEFREIIERYVALSLSLNEVEESFGENKRELFRISKSPNIELSAICLNRMNQYKLRNHQSNARKDFVNLINKIIVENVGENTILANVVSIANELNDSTLLYSLNEITSKTFQNQKLSLKSTKFDLKISTT